MVHNINNNNFHLFNPNYMTEVKALHAIFIRSFHAPCKSAALVFGAPGHPPELSSCSSCRMVAQHGSSASSFTDSLRPQLGTFILWNFYLLIPSCLGVPLSNLQWGHSFRAVSSKLQLPLAGGYSWVNPYCLHSSLSNEPRNWLFLLSYSPCSSLPFPGTISPKTYLPSCPF